MLAWCLAIAVSSAQEWTRFRGPNGAGISESTKIPANWTDADYNWKAELPGIGHSSPVLWGDKIFLTSADETNATRYVLCVSTVDGKIVWQKEYSSTLHNKHERNSFASATAAVDEDHVYVVWSAPETYSILAFTHDGQQAWTRDLGPYVSQHSCGTSPIVYKDMVIIGNDQDGESSLIALNRNDGETIWNVPRNHKHVAYSTPCVLSEPGAPDLLIFNSAAHGISGVDPLSGKTLWELAVFDKRSVSSPVVAGGLIYGSCGSGGGGNYLVALRPPKDFSGTPEIAYRIEDAAPYVPTVVTNGDQVFLWSDKGIVSCVNVADGTVLNKKRIGGDYSGSPIRVQDRLYCIADDGQVVVLSANKELDVLAKIALGEPCRSTPAVAGDRIYFRTYSHLFSLGGK